jgi:hypothetical protein
MAATARALSLGRNSREWITRQSDHYGENCGGAFGGFLNGRERARLVVSTRSHCNAVGICGHVPLISYVVPVVNNDKKERDKRQGLCTGKSLFGGVHFFARNTQKAGIAAFVARKDNVSSPETIISSTKLFTGLGETRVEAEAVRHKRYGRYVDLARDAITNIFIPELYLKFCAAFINGQRVCGDRRSNLNSRSMVGSKFISHYFGLPESNPAPNKSDEANNDRGSKQGERIAGQISGVPRKETFFVGVAVWLLSFAIIFLGIGLCICGCVIVGAITIACGVVCLAINCGGLAGFVPLASAYWEPYRQ